MTKNPREENPVEIDLRPYMHVNQLGSLLALELSDVAGFDVERFYSIQDVPPDGRRGGHAHKTLVQLLIMHAGSSTLELCNPKDRWVFHLRAGSNAVLVPPGFWREMYAFSVGAVLGVFASSRFDGGDYIHSWTEYEEWWSKIDSLR